MKVKEALRSKEVKENVIKTKFALFGFVLILALFLFVLNVNKVNAATSAEVTATRYKQDGTNFADYGKVDLTTDGGQTLTFIQGNGKDDEVAIKFTITDFPSSATSFAIVENEESDSGSGDLDRYSKVGAGWSNTGSGNLTLNGITGSATPRVDDPSKVDIVYRLRKGGFGMRFLKVFFYNSSLETCGEDTKCSSSIEVWYVIAQPIHTLGDAIDSDSCASETLTTICIEYNENAEGGREPKPLKLYLPETVAYEFKILDVDDALVDDQYKDKDQITIYAINYFKESDGVGTIVDKIEDANKSYLYTNFELSGSDTAAVTGDLEVPFMNYRNSFKINKIAYISMEVDATGTYFFYITDIFGNVNSQAKQKVDNVVNRTIYTKISKGNRTGDVDDWGFDDAETFTNESVKITLVMTVETKFEFGECLNNKCTEVVDLTPENVKYVKYWRVDVKIQSGVDRDAYVSGDPVTKQYASESYAYDNEFYYLVCKDGCPTGVTGIQTWSAEADQTKEDTAGFASFTGNTLTMYIALSGRYRFYIEDVYGNNTWGDRTTGDLAAMEYRNPRVELYGIDKHAPEITFEHDNGVKNVDGTDLKIFDIETFEYYQGVDTTATNMSELTMATGTNYQYDGRMTGAAEAGTITTGIYYPVNRDGGRSADKPFTDDLSKVLSKVRATENVYYYNGNKDEYSNYSVYDRETGSYYVMKAYDADVYEDEVYDNGRLNTISKNTKHNSVGLLNGEDFEFIINYYHNDGKTSICDYLGEVDEAYAEKTELQCVNYYLDHGVDFIIEFGATDTVGNVSYAKVYVDVVDTTTPGFIQPMKDAEGEGATGKVIDDERTVKTSNIGTQCRMEVGSEMGAGITSQNKEKLLDCYNVIVDEAYNFEDNVYGSDNSGLSYYNRINSTNYVRLSILSDVKNGDDEYYWINLEDSVFIPNETGYHDLKIEIFDGTKDAQGTNVLTILVSYYVDKRIVLIKPVEESKNYGDDDPTLFNYCVLVNQSNKYDASYFENPYSATNLALFSQVYCTNQTTEEITEGKAKLFRENVDTTDFTGTLTRLESIWYNGNLSVDKGAPNNYKTPIYSDAVNQIGVENNYVGDEYRVILGTLNINTYDEDDNFIADEDYVVKIHPTYRDSTKHNSTTANDNLITTSTYFEDDLPYAQSNVKFIIKQVVLKVSANGSQKNYGEKDVNYTNYNKDNETTNPYLGGYSVVSGLKYEDSSTIVLGVLRRVIGENVGIYSICNYRGTDTADNALENTNNMYTNCADQQTSGITIDNGVAKYQYTDGIIVMNESYIKSRALYIETNKTASGKTLNVTTDSRNNNYANYIIEYTGDVYTIKPIDLVFQPAPGQRREYNRTSIYEPDPWEIILYGLVDGNIKRVEDDDPTFNGYTLSILESDYYSAQPNEKDTEDGSEVSKLEANASETRTTWKLIHGGKTLVGYKTNETYQLLRNTTSEVAGSAILTRQSGNTGGWYLYNPLGNDTQIEGITESRGNSVVSSIAVITNGNNHCSYDVSSAGNGHTITGVNGSLPCKNYNLVYNPYYTNDDGYTIETMDDSLHEESDFIYKSNGKLCTEADPGLVCSNTLAEPLKIYKIQFEIYRREIIMEFNSAIETIKLTGTNLYEIVYGKRYEFFKDNYFNIDYYDGVKKHNGNVIYAEDYLFICYKNETTKSTFDPDNATTTGCTGDYRYGLTEGDTWSNIGLKFWMHDLISKSTSGYYSESDDKAIPAGAYYIYADIKEEEKVNYRFTYLGGALTIKSKSVDIIMTSFLKEYGEAYYSKYGNGSNYDSFTEFTKACINDGLIINDNSALISGISCNESDVTLDSGNTNKNIYGFVIDGLDLLDAISNNFTGRPDRDRSVSSASKDTNGLQDNVGIYTIDKGSVKTVVNNGFLSSNACAEIGDITAANNLCVVVTGVKIENYVLVGESRTYVFDMYQDDITSTKPIIGSPTTTNGSLFIVPATLTITVSSNQTKMYGCAYNKFNTNVNLSSYSYADGYANCVEDDGNHYDLGYKYTVSGDKDYQIANNGFEYESNDTYDVSGIKGSSTFRPTTITTEGAIKAHALNDFGTLYRIADSAANRANIMAATYYGYATDAQLVTGKKYQGQTVGTYILTLGNVDAAINSSNANMKNTCNANNMPDADGDYACKNYHIDYYGTHVNPSDADQSQKYEKTVDGSKVFPTELLFTITTRKVYVYTDYDQKIYGDADPDVSYLCGDYNMDGKVDDDDNVDGVNGDVVNGFCYQAQVDANKDGDNSNDVRVGYGITRYYTKYNSLAKYPWNGINGRNDVQFDVIGGKVSRKGELSDGSYLAPQTDDTKGFYEYVYEDSDFNASVALKEYGAANYTVNYYNADGLAVNVDGKVQNDTGEKKIIKFEIVLREIKIAFVSFDKVYGEHDDVDDYDILVCAPTDEFDFENMKCIVKDENDPHGLSNKHKNEYMSNGILNQTKFKEDFIVRYKRVLGENVSCGTSSDVAIQLDGYFFGPTEEVNVLGTVYTKTLKCNTTAVEDKSVYETLAYIDQTYSAAQDYGYNYKVNYTIGYVNIVKRNILITPESGQGFVYGDYYDTLIPSIKFSDSLDTTNTTLDTKQTYGLVNDTSSSQGICLKNIDYYNNGDDAGTCFNINDRKDEYNSGNSKTTSVYDSDAVDSDTGLESLLVKNFVFGDTYISESSTRSALNRGIGTNSNARYNRNVGVYNILLGDLVDKTGNYEIAFASGIKYTISSADIYVTPDATVYENTTQNNQYKIYGEQDKELTFSVITTYTVKYSHYAKYYSSIQKVCSKDNVCIVNANLDRFNYTAATDSFTKVEGGDYIYLVKDDVVTVNGYVYGENDTDNSKNYGVSKIGTKANTVDESVNQGSVGGSKYYDIACKDVSENVGCNANRELSYGETSRILLGYLHVENYSQAAGTYNIVSGLKSAINEFDQNNYKITFTDGVKFTIIPRPIGVQIQNVTKTYGQTTDKISCEVIDGTMIENCSPANDILDSSADGYLRYNFTIEYFSGSARIEDILGNNKILYSQNSTFVNGLVTKANYSAYETAETKNSNHLGVYVSRDERNTSNSSCLYDGDTYGFCEDAGTYYLRFYGYYNTIDDITKNSYQSVYKFSDYGFSGAVSSVSTYYYSSYFGYNPNYFVIVVESDTIADVETDEVAVENIFATSAASTNRKVSNEAGDKLLKSTGTLTINKKDVNIYVGTTYYGEGAEIYYIQQNSNPPSLPTIDNSSSLDLKYESFDEQREAAVYSASSYGKVIWGRRSTQVRTGDKLVGEVAYCNKIITSSAYYQIRDEGLSSDYSCSNLLYQDNKNSLNTQLEGYIPIVRDIDELSIANKSATEANATYENTNYTVMFYPGGLRIEEDDTKPVVQVNRPDVYIEANAVGEYLYECVTKEGKTVYTDCEEGATKISVVGKTELVEGDPILNIFNQIDDNGKMFYYESNGTKHYADAIIKASLPVIDDCEGGTGHACTASAYYQLNYGKGKDNFISSGGIISNQESTLVEPFTMQQDTMIKNGGPSNLKELINTLVSWFGVTAYDAGEVRNGELLDKAFDKYWYIVLEKEGTNGDFNIGKVGKYKIHFYVMDNAGNVSEGNMYNDAGVLEGGYSNVATLHIVDTTKPIVGQINFYNGKVECKVQNCTIEGNWTVKEDTYVPMNILGRYDSEGNPSSSGNYVITNTKDDMKLLSTLKKYNKVSSPSGVTYVEDSSGKYIKIAAGSNALALKHYSWSNSPVGIYMTITGGSDNSYSEISFPDREAVDNSQWQHYYSRDGGITWFLYDRTNKDGVLALDADGTREIIIKAVDVGVKIDSLSKGSSTYITKYYGSGNANNKTSAMDVYTFTDTSVHDDWLKSFAEKTEDEQKADDNVRHEKIALVGWNISDWSTDNETKATTISKLIYGTDTNTSGYKYYRDKQTAYLDRTSPVITFGTGNGEDIYIYEYGCGLTSCSTGYTEYYAAAVDNFVANSRESASGSYNKNNSIFINHSLYVPGAGSKYQGSYTNISQETLNTKSAVGGLGSDMYGMNGSNVGTDIRNVYKEERRYVIYAFDEDNTRTVHDLSSLIPESSSSTDGEDNIYDVILHNIPENYNKGDYTYTIVYSVIDKAGNESIYIARGVIFASLIPIIEVESEDEIAEEIEENVFKLNVTQGDEVSEIVQGLNVKASTGLSNKINYLTQTVYYNGEMISKKQQYNPNINEMFNTNTPGVYEVVYTLSYLYESDGEYELIDAKPVKLVINVEATQPVVKETNKVNYLNIVLVFTMMLGAVFICLVGVVNKRKI